MRVGDRNGVVTFNQSDGEGAAKDWNQSGSIRKPKRHLETWPTVKFETQIEVPIVRLGDWALDKNLGPVDLVWADTQGAESDLVAGGASVIRSARWLFIEYGVIEYYEGQITLDDLCGALFDLGLVLYRKFPLDALFVNKNLIDLKQIKFPIRRKYGVPLWLGTALQALPRQRAMSAHGRPWNTGSSGQAGRRAE